MTAFPVLERGPWTVARNLAADARGSIHDDTEARRRGLPGGLVPGNVQLVLVQRGVVEQLGPSWYERGTLDFTWARPVYDGEELRLLVSAAEEWAGDERALGFVLEKRDGSPAARGGATLARSLDVLEPPWQGAEPTPRGSERDPLPDEPIGHVYASRKLALPAAAVERTLAGLDPTPWYSEASPWGAPILPAAAFLPITGQGRRPRASDEARPAPRASGRAGITAGMNGALALVQTGPMFLDHTYERRTVLVDKGFARRTAFRTVEISLHDDAGRRVALARWRVNWFPRPDA